MGAGLPLIVAGSGCRLLLRVLLPVADQSAPVYTAPLDEVMLVYTSGVAVNLARTYGPGSPFWSQWLASPNADATLVSFNYGPRCATS